MGIEIGFFVFLRPSQHGGKNKIGRPGTKEKEIGFERNRERERERERERGRYPSFQNR